MVFFPVALVPVAFVGLSLPRLVLALDFTANAREQAAQSSEGRLHQCLAGKRIVYVGPSTSKYEYLALAYFAEYGKWPDAHMDPNPLYEWYTLQSLHIPPQATTPVHKLGCNSGGQTETFMRYTNLLFNQHEVCDCHSNGLWTGPTDTYNSTENRLYVNGDTLIAYFQWFGNVVQPRGTFDPVNVFSQPPLPVHQMCPVGQFPGRWAWQMNIIDFISSIVKQARPTHLVLDAAFWPMDGFDHSFWELLTQAGVGAIMDTGGTAFYRTVPQRGATIDPSGAATVHKSDPYVDRFKQAGWHVWDAQGALGALRGTLQDDEVFVDFAHLQPWMTAAVAKTFVETFVCPGVANAPVSAVARPSNWFLAQADPVYYESCFPDRLGDRSAAGAAMAVCIVLTVMATWGGVLFVANVGASGCDDSGERRPLVVSRPPRIDTLDGIRTLLVTCVILGHYPSGFLFSAYVLEPACSMQFFFVLSGFLAQCTQEGARDSFDLSSGGVYVLRRMVRLIPLYQLALIGHFAVAVANGRACKPLAAWPLNALFLQTIFPVKICGQADFSWTLGYTALNSNGVGWFVAALIWISSVFPLLFNALPRGGVSYTLAMFFAVIGCRSLLDPLDTKWGSFGEVGPHLYAFAPIRLMEFTAGMLSAQVASHVGSQVRAWSWWCLAFDGALMLVAAAAVVAVRLIGITWSRSGDYHLVIPSCLLCVVARFAAELHPNLKTCAKSGMLHSLFSSWPLVFLSRYTFAAYIFQNLVMGTSNTFSLWRFTLLWVVAVVAYEFIEQPLAACAEVRLRAKRPTKLYDA